MESRTDRARERWGETGRDGDKDGRIARATRRSIRVSVFIRCRNWKRVMRLKLALVIVFAIAVAAPGALLAGQAGLQRDCEGQPGKCGDEARKLDFGGNRGVVCFRHKAHEGFANPDESFAHQAETGADCVSCHHARSEAKGTPLLWKCTACHRGAGDPLNPRNREMDEVSSERAFHDLCIGCHRASNDKGLSKCKAPVACSECHGSRY